MISLRGQTARNISLYGASGERGEYYYPPPVRVLHVVVAVKSVRDSACYVSTYVCIRHQTLRHCLRTMSKIMSKNDFVPSLTAHRTVPGNRTGKRSAVLIVRSGRNFLTNHCPKLSDCWSSTCWKTSGKPNFSDKVCFSHNHKSYRC